MYVGEVFLYEKWVRVTSADNEKIAWSNLYHMYPHATTLQMRVRWQNERE